MPPDDEVVECNTMVWTLLCAFRVGGGGGAGNLMWVLLTNGQSPESGGG